MGKIKGWKKQGKHHYYGNTWWLYKDDIATVSVSSKIGASQKIRVHTPTTVKKFDTRSKAMEYAIAYMRRYNG